MNILEFLQSEGFVPKAKNQSEYSSPCPMCGGNDRFSSWPDRNRWHCRGCNRAGDLIELVQSCKGLSFSEACRFIGEDHRVGKAGAYGCAVFGEKKRGLKDCHVWQPKQVETTSSCWLEKAKALIDWSHGQLLSNTEKLDWLKVGRGISLETVKRFKLGWNPKDLFRERNEWGLPEELSEKTGKPKKLFIPAGLVIPGWDFSAGINLVKIRRPNPPEGQAKYYFLPGGVVAPCFFGDNLKNFIVVESELDAVLLSQESGGMLSAVSMGSAANRPDSKSFEILCQAERLMISLDSDDAGGKAGVRFWVESFPSATLDFIPSEYGKDHGAAYLAGFPISRWLACRVKRNIEQKESPNSDNKAVSMVIQECSVEFRTEPAPGPKIKNDVAAEKSLDAKMPTSDEVLIFQAVELESQAGAAGMIEVAYELDRALGTFCQSGEIAVERGFAHSVLKSAIDRAVAALKCRKMNSPATVAA